MRITLSLIKADIGSIGGHITPTKEVVEAVKTHVKSSSIVIDSYIFYTGDDVAILMTHTLGKDNEQIHKLAWDALMAGTQVAKAQGLYGAGQDLLKDSFSGNVKGMGPAVAELEFEERPNEPFVVFAADKTDPGAYNLPFYLSFADPMHCSGLMLSPAISKGFKFRIMDVSNTEADKVIDLNAPEELYHIAALLRETDKYVISEIYSKTTGEQAVSISTTRLHNIAGKYTGKDDPIALVRAQGSFPATGELITPYAICHYVAGFMRGSHQGPLMPVKKCSTISFFDGPPIVTAQAFCVQNGKLQNLLIYLIMHSGIMLEIIVQEKQLKSDNKDSLGMQCLA